MAILIYLILGVIVSRIGRLIFTSTDEGFIPDSVLGVAGAAVAGQLYNEFAASGAASLTAASLLVATSGAVVLIVASHLMVRTRGQRQREPERRQRGLLRNRP